MKNTSEKFMILESKTDGKRTIVPKRSRVDLKRYEVCGYGPTRASLQVALLWLKPSIYSK